MITKKPAAWTQSTSVNKGANSTAEVGLIAIFFDLFAEGFYETYLL